MGRGKTERLGDILRNVLTRRALSTGYQRSRIASSLCNVLDGNELQHCRVGNIRNGCLTLLVDSPSMLYEIRAFRSSEILVRLNEAGHNEITRIKFEFESPNR